MIAQEDRDVEFWLCCLPENCMGFNGNNEWPANRETRKFQWGSAYRAGPTTDKPRNAVDFILQGSLVPKKSLNHRDRAHQERRKSRPSSHDQRTYSRCHQNGGKFRTTLLPSRERQFLQLPKRRRSKHNPKKRRHHPRQPHPQRMNPQPSTAWQPRRQPRCPSRIW